MRISIAAAALMWILAGTSTRAASFDPHGNLWVTCHAGSLTGHEFKGGTHIYRFKGQCEFGGKTWVSNQPYSIEGTWDGERAKEKVDFPGNGGITSVALCTNFSTQGVQLVDPWLDFALCSTISRNRSVSSGASAAFLLLLDQWAAPDPQSAAFLSVFQRQSLAQELPKVRSIVRQAKVIYPPDGYVAKFGEKVSFHVIADPADQLRLIASSPLTIFALTNSKQQGNDVYLLYQLLTPGEQFYQFGSPFINPSPVRKLIVGNP
ncbi:hypothetical protein [Bradyrhizobium sp. BR13661]|jgi:hypothetical protein|uniref:hypothetical protein n=1 Tax=Bradyrhizobium sp. BR13661 TaxID=2940622 RepID=UPI002474B51F|nr:hypothetical protein [Bradyrhizobium sp. BR13661]MDH6260670.1 hypothetical protein [Bradyrhizobium sp. BR13661]